MIFLENKIWVYLIRNVCDNKIDISFMITLVSIASNGGNQLDDCFAFYGIKRICENKLLNFVVHVGKVDRQCSDRKFSAKNADDGFMRRFLLSFPIRDCCTKFFRI